MLHVSGDDLEEDIVIDMEWRERRKQTSPNVFLLRKPDESHTYEDNDRPLKA